MAEAAERLNMETFESRYLSGASLYGDDFDEAGIRRWYGEEEHGYFELVKTYPKYVYSYHALNHHHVWRFLRPNYECCVAMGCAKGDDVSPLAPRVDRFVAIEPAEQWWNPAINGKPAHYMKPSLIGDIPLADSAADLVVCLGVLHHIPNASHVFAEMARVLKPGGHMAVREPVCTMGDWRNPRRGLTPNERGFPPGWFESRAAARGLRIARAAHCSFPLTTRLARWLRLEPAFNNRALVRLDAAMSRLTRWNLHYHRDSVFKKIAPIDMAYLFEKQGNGQ